MRLETDGRRFILGFWLCSNCKMPLNDVIRNEYAARTGLMRKTEILVYDEL